MISDLNNGDIEAIERYNSIKKANKNEIEQHKFEQFIATKQIKENKEALTPLAAYQLFCRNILRNSWKD